MKLKFLAILLLFPFILMAVPAIPLPVKVAQPDGSSLTLRVHGDRFFSYNTTEDGYVIFENEDGYYVYAERSDDGELVPSKVIARDEGQRTSKDRVFLAAYHPYEAFSVKTMQKVPKHSGCDLVSDLEAQESGMQKAYPTKGAPRGIVLLVNFKDVKYTVPEAQQAFAQMMNEKGYSANGAVGSARDYFVETSMGQFTPTFDVFGPYELPKVMSYYGYDKSESEKDTGVVHMVTDACRLAYENGVNFANYDFDNDGVVDNVFIYYAGFNQAEGGSSNTIWPHRSTVGNYLNMFNGKIVYGYACTSERTNNLDVNVPNPHKMTGIGTFCHEFSHVLGLVDLYNTRTDTTKRVIPWVGDNDLMHSGNYLRYGTCPPTFSAFERFHVGWLTPEFMDTPTDSVVLKPLSSSNQTYVISKTKFNNNAIDQDPTTVYFLENRQKVGFDSCMPGHGMLAWSVQYDRYKWSANIVNTELPFNLIIERADSSASSAYYFPGDSNVRSFTPSLADYKYATITNIREDTSNKQISFRFMGGTGAPYLSLSTSSIKLGNTGGEVDSFKIRSNTTWSITPGTPSAFNLSATSGTGDAVIRVTTKNATTNSSSQTIKVYNVNDTNIAGTIKLIQENTGVNNRCGWICNYNLSKDSLFRRDLDPTGKSTVLWGDATGQNNFYMPEMAELFRNTGERIVDTIGLRLFQAGASRNNPNSNATFRIYAANGEMPGDVLYEQNVPLKDIVFQEDSLFYVSLKSPVVVNGNFFVGYVLYFDQSPLDTFICTFAKYGGRPVETSTAVLKFRNVWMDFHEFFRDNGADAFYISLAIDAHLQCLSNVDPVVNLQNSVNVDDTLVLLKATLERTGSQPVVQRGFEYSYAPFNEGTGTKVVAGQEISVGDYQYTFKGTKDQVLYFRAFATNAGGLTVYSSSMDSIVIGQALHYLTVSPGTVHLSPRAQGVAYLTVLTDLDWQLSCDSAWLKFDTNSGSGNTNLKLSVASENTDTLHGRSAVVQFTAGTLKYMLNVYQDPKAPFVAPELTTYELSNMTCNGGLLNGEVFTDGNGTVSERGFYYNHGSNSTVDTNSLKVKAGVGVGQFSAIISGIPIKKYVYCRAYAITEKGITLSPVSKSRMTLQEDPSIKLSATQFEANANATPEYTVTITTNMAWKVSADQDWVDLDKTEGLSSGTLKIKVNSENTAAESRIANITIEGAVTRVITVVQLGTSGTVTFSVNPLYIDFLGTKDTVAFINIFCDGSWSINNSADWIRLNQTSGTGNATVTVTASKTVTEPRSTELTVTSGNDSKQVSIVQRKTVAVKEAQEEIRLSITPNPVSTYFTISTNDQRIKELDVLGVDGCVYPVRSQISGTEATVFVNNLSNGFYIVRVKTAKAVYTEKFIKQ